MKATDNEDVLRQVKLWEWLAGVGIIIIIAGIILPIQACACSRAQTVQCLSNTKQQAVAMATYAADWDYLFPNRDHWMDRITPLIKQKDALRDPEVEIANMYGYAFDSRLSSASAFKQPDPAKAPLLYDSINLGKNASDPFTSLPVKGRHKGRNNIAYADGHARSTRLEATK